jgi:ATP synthase protein I
MLGNKETRKIFEQLTLVSQLGLTMVGSIGLGFAIGYYLDKWVGTRGIFLTLFILLGIGGGGYTVYRQIRELEDSESMSDYATLKKALIKKALLLSLAAACIFLALNLKSAAKGIALGSIFSVVEFKLMALRLERRFTRQKRARDYFGLVGRIFLLSIPLVIAIKHPSINLAATVGGIFAVKAAIYYHFLISNRYLSAKTEEKAI